ncbi:unnamed protein product, partial [marine sediment metagenome]
MGKIAESTISKKWLTNMPKSVRILMGLETGDTLEWF